MKVFVLTCIAQDGELISVELFRSIVLAHEAMVSRHEQDKEQRNERDIDDDYTWVHERCACCGNEEYYRYYEITEAEL